MASPTELAAVSAEIGASMTGRDACPCCGGAHLESVACRNDLHGIEGVSDSMKDSDYHGCLECGLIFARRRQSSDGIELFYRWFAHLEERDYAVYPPPRAYVQGKADTANSHLKKLIVHGALAPGMTIAHFRCDVGSLLAQIDQQFPGCRLHGYDYFDSNIRYAHDQGRDWVEKLDASGITLAGEGDYDLIICNHIFTHAFEPAADLRMIARALKPGGVLYLYGEVDHRLRFEPKGPYYQWVALNNYHKQLFAPTSMEYFLTKGGFSIEARDHRGFYMQLLARQDAVTGDEFRDKAVTEAAKAAAPVLIENFRRWVELRKSPMHGAIKVVGKLKKALRPPS